MVKEAEIIEQQSAARQPAAVQAAPASDYSAQWAEYYRSIGKVKEAEAIEQQMRAKGGSVPPSGAPQYGGAPQHAAPYGGGQQYQPGPHYENAKLKREMAVGINEDAEVRKEFGEVKEGFAVVMEELAEVKEEFTERRKILM